MCCYLHKFISFAQRFLSSTLRDILRLNLSISFHKIFKILDLGWIIKSDTTFKKIKKNILKKKKVYRLVACIFLHKCCKFQVFISKIVSVQTYLIKSYRVCTVNFFLHPHFFSNFLKVMPLFIFHVKYL